MENGILWAATDVEIRSRVYPQRRRQVAIEDKGIVYRNSYSDPLLFRDVVECESFISTLSKGY